MMTEYENDLDFCRHLARKGFMPYARVNGVEICSYPYPEKGNVYIQARTSPGDATTMKTFQIVLAKLVEVR